MVIDSLFRGEYLAQQDFALAQLRVLLYNVMFRNEVKRLALLCNIFSAIIFEAFDPLVCYTDMSIRVYYFAGPHAYRFPEPIAATLCLWLYCDVWPDILGCIGLDKMKNKKRFDGNSGSSINIVCYLINTLLRVIYISVYFLITMKSFLIAITTLTQRQL